MGSRSRRAQGGQAVFGPLSRFRKFCLCRQARRTVIWAAKRASRLSKFTKIISVKKTSAAAAQIGKRKSITPTEVATPLGPLNFRNGE